MERSPDPRDRRGVLVGLTATGKKAVDGAFETLLASERELLADLSDEDHAPAGRAAQAADGPAQLSCFIAQLTSQTTARWSEGMTPSTASPTSRVAATSMTRSG